MPRFESNSPHRLCGERCRPFALCLLTTWLLLGSIDSLSAQELAESDDRPAGTVETPVELSAEQIKQESEADSNAVSESTDGDRSDPEPVSGESGEENAVDINPLSKKSEEQDTPNSADSEPAIETESTVQVVGESLPIVIEIVADSTSNGDLEVNTEPAKHLSAEDLPANEVPAEEVPAEEVPAEEVSTEPAVGPSKELEAVIDVLHESAESVIETETEASVDTPSGSFLRIVEPGDYSADAIKEDVDEVISPSDVDAAGISLDPAPSLAELRQRRAAELARLRSIRLQQQIRYGYSPLRPRWNAIPMMSSRYSKPVILVPIYTRKTN